MATNPTMKERKISTYLIVGVIGILAVIVGFSKTFFIPLSKGDFHAPILVHVHGVFAFSWVIFYSVQSFLVYNKSLRLHRTWGWLGAFLAIGVSLTMLPAGLFQVNRDFKMGLGNTAISSMLGVATGGIIFTFLVGLGFYFRRKPEIHKAMMLVATLFVLWPAWFRFRHFFPGVPRPDIWFGLILSNSMIAIALIIDYIQTRRFNKFIAFAGSIVIIESTIEVTMFDSTPWRLLSQLVYDNASGWFANF